ncbi:MAG: hypothetical protein ABIL68_17015 [bacterium]
MEDQALEDLEVKINKILTLMDEYKKENQELRNRNQELQTLFEEKEKSLMALKTESEDVLGMKSEITMYREKQDRIRSKVEALLLKLKEFEDIQ